MNTFRPDDAIPVAFSRQQWEHVLTMLARQPFNEVAQLIADIQRQCQMHEMRQRAGQTPPRLAPQDYGPVEPKAAE